MSAPFFLLLFTLQAPGETPIGPKWWPSEWGAEDQRGAANRLTPGKVLEAARLIREGKITSLGHLYEKGMPMVGPRSFQLSIPGSPTGHLRGDNQFIFFDDFVVAHLGQVGTQMDGLGHAGVRLADDDTFYNGFKRSEIARPYGLEKLGVENAGVFFTRGVLVDAAALKNVERLQIGELVSPEDLRAALSRQKLELREGDAVLIRTGHGRLWMKNNQEYSRGMPGLSIEAARWLAAQKVALVGSDNWSISAFPYENPKRPEEVHHHLLVRNGIYLLENLNLEALSRDGTHEFAFIFSPLRLKGATGSPGNPIAVK